MWGYKIMSIDLKRAEKLTDDKEYLCSIIRQIKEDLQHNQQVMAFIKIQDLLDM